MRKLILIGGGEIKDGGTLGLDESVAKAAQAHAGEGKRPYALFIGTASHDYMPYYNTFHKIYTGKLGLKTDVALSVFTKSTREHLKEKFDKADVLYIGGGDTVFMLESWRESGMLELIDEAYRRGVPVAGLSAGAICWGADMFTDSAKTDGKYALAKGIGVLPWGVCPHFDNRKAEFETALTQKGTDVSGEWLCIENGAAVVLEDEKVLGSLSCGGQAVMRTADGEMNVIPGVPTEA